MSTMDGGNLVPISRPTTVSVKVDPTLKECESDGFGVGSSNMSNIMDLTFSSSSRISVCSESWIASFYARKVSMSDHRLRIVFLQLQTQEVGSWPPQIRVRVDATVGHWNYIHTTYVGLILSPLNELQKALESDDAQPVFKPQKTIAFSAQPIILAFACNETRFLVGLAQGEVLLYDVDKLFSPGSDDAPLHALRTSNSPARQIVPNPSSDPALADYIAIVRFDGNVEVVNMQFQSQGGWTAREHDALPVAGMSGLLYTLFILTIYQHPGHRKANSLQLA